MRPSEWAGQWPDPADAPGVHSEARLRYDAWDMLGTHHQTSTLALPSAGRLRLVCVADTHGRPHPDAARIIAARRPDAILHAGDIGEGDVIAQLSALAPTIAVRGNIDPADGSHVEIVTLHVAGADGQPKLTLLLTHIAVRGPRLRADARAAATEAGADIVVCGHSHVPFLANDRGIAVFNPGSIGPRRFGLPIVFGVLDIGPKGVAFEHVDCETGERWHPR
ncbi:MAG: putative phosphoesterase [Myxococcota bacterium]|jgi:putative phosphoesterase